MSQFDTQEFIKLKKKWDKILRENGFTDIETYYSNGRPHHMLNRPAFNGGGAHTPSPEKFQEVSEYYRLARHFLYDYSFSTLEEKQIWELHADGVSYRNIISRLGLSVCPATLGKRINRLKSIMLEGLYERQT